MRMDRLNEMEQYILQRGTASLPDLAKHFGVSTNTIRRDVNALISRGRINKVYGGVSANETAVLLPFTERAIKNDVEKQAIGALAAKLVPDKSAIFLDSGSTTPCILPYLSEKENITIVTHSLSVMYEAVKYPSLNVLALGGMFNHTTSSYIGNTDEMLGRIHLQAAFMAASAVSLKWGLGNNTYDEFKIKEAICRHNDNIILMADHTKFDTVACYTFCRFSALSAVVTDQMPAKHYVDAMRDNGTRLYFP